MKRTLRVNDDPSTPAVQTLSSVSKNVAAKVLRAVHGEEFFGQRRQSALCAGRKKSALPFLTRSHGCILAVGREHAPGRDGG